MSFDLFVQSCISLKRMTDVFKRYDTDRDGYITLSFEDFLTGTYLPVDLCFPALFGSSLLVLRAVLGHRTAELLRLCVPACYFQVPVGPQVACRWPAGPKLLWLERAVTRPLLTAFAEILNQR